jgi:hypothetical protein
MSVTNEQIIGKSGQRLTIRISRTSLSFAAFMANAEHENPIVYEPYVVRSGISMAANLREALKDAELPSMGIRKARVMVDTPVLMTPVELFSEKTMAEEYHHAYPQTEQLAVLYNVLPDLNAVAVFAMNRDLKLVVSDHFEDVQYIAALTPVWRHLHQRSFTSQSLKLYAYFHDKKVDVFAYQMNRFKFYNQFDTNHAHDALYFLLYVWKQLMMDVEKDEMHLVGDIPEQEWLVDELKKYIRKAYVINPSADFNRAPVTEIKGMPYDLQTLYVKGR